MRYNNLISPLTTLYENLWHWSMFYVSYMTLYDFQECFLTSIENQIYTVFSLWNFLYDPCIISRKSYMVFVWLPRIQTNHIWPGMITKNHIWPSTKSKIVVWSLTRDTTILGSLLLNPSDTKLDTFFLHMNDLEFLEIAMPYQEHDKLILLKILD